MGRGDVVIDRRGKSLGRPALYALLAVALYLTYLVVRPFLAAFTWAVVFAILFHDMQTALVRRMKPNAAALVTTLVVAAAIVAPAVVLVSTLAREAPRLASSMKQSSQNAPAQLRRIWDAARARSPIPMPDDPTEIAAKGASRAAAFLAEHAGALAADSLATLGTLVAMLFALFFMVRDGDALRNQLRDRLPFSEPESERLMSQTRDLVMASVGASVVVAAAQGIVGGLTFWLLGLGAPAFWGVVIAFCSLLPVGAAIVWLPAAAWLLVSGDIGRGVLMLLAGTFGISMVDNILRPVLLAGRTSISGFVIFFGLLGGAAAFGPVGLVIGPIILVITPQLLDNLRHPDRLDAPVENDDRTVVGRPL